VSGVREKEVSRFFSEGMEKEAMIMGETGKYWTIEAKRKSLGEVRQGEMVQSRNQFRKTTIFTKTIMRSQSNNYCESEKLRRNEKLMENWRIKKKSLI
jgi:hypothetical protein